MRILTNLSSNCIFFSYSLYACEVENDLRTIIIYKRYKYRYISIYIYIYIVLVLDYYLVLFFLMGSLSFIDKNVLISSQ